MVVCAREMFLLKRSDFRAANPFALHNWHHHRQHDISVNGSQASQDWVSLRSLFEGQNQSRVERASSSGFVSVKLLTKRAILC